MKYPLVVILLLPLLTHTTQASRAYPHGCLYRHPSYYTYDERDDISWAQQQQQQQQQQREDGPFGDDLKTTQMDFRYLPSKSSELRKSYERYRLTKRLGAGKFSEVYEAVDLEFGGKNKRRVVVGVGVGRSNDGETTECSTEMEEDEIDDCLVVLKYLKPISERKIRRELLALTHCATLPNVARLIGIALPDSFDKDEENDNEASNSQADNPKKRRRKKEQQVVDLGSITDAAAGIESNNKSKHGNHKQTEFEEQLPALILEHAGTHSKWFCHGPRHKHNNADYTQKDSDYLSEREMKYYLCHLLIALDALHSAGIIHRDVKPRNCLINFPSSYNKKSLSISTASENVSTLPPPPLMLVDLGLADFYLPGKEYNVRVASRHYKSPELLIGFSYYDYAIDMWSVGCILAGLLFRREPFFRGKDNEDQLGKIVSVLGTRDFLPYVRKCDVRLTSGMRSSIGKYCSVALSGEKDVTSSNVARRKPWLSFLTPECPIPSSEALDLLDKLLIYDHEQRWTAAEAIGHSFFDEVRDEVWREVQERMLWESQWRSRMIPKK